MKTKLPTEHRRAGSDLERRKMLLQKLLENDLTLARVDGQVQVSSQAVELFPEKARERYAEADKLVDFVMVMSMGEVDDLMRKACVKSGAFEFINEYRAKQFEEERSKFLVFAVRNELDREPEFAEIAAASTISQVREYGAMLVTKATNATTI